MATTCYRHNPIQRPDPARVTPAEPSSTAMSSDFANLPIREAASEVIDIEHSVPLDGEFDVALGDTFTDAAIASHTRGRNAPRQSATIA